MLIGLNFCEFTCMRCYSADTVNPPISTQGAYFKFRRRRGGIYSRGKGCLIEGGRLYNFSQIVA